jgi:hypothetical protein
MASVDDLINDLSNFGSEVQDLSLDLAQIGADIEAGIRSRAPVKTGALAQSIRVFVTQDSLAFEMLDYGVFQNYGVKGVDNTASPLLTPEEGISFGGIAATSRFSFGTGNFSKGGRPWGAYYSGIGAQSFFSIDAMAQDVADTIGTNLIDNF